MDSFKERTTGFSIGGYSFTQFDEILDLPEKQELDVNENTAVDITIEQPILLLENPAPDNNIALTIYQLWDLYQLLETYSLRADSRLNEIIICSTKIKQLSNFQKSRLRLFYEKMFGGIKHIPGKHKHVRVLLKQALFLVNKGVFNKSRSRSTYAFRQWVLESFQLEARKKTKKVEKIILIERKSYRNERGFIKANLRTIANADELSDVIRTHFPNSNFMRVRLETLAVEKQIELLANADLVISTHGAGLVFASSLVPENSGIIELLPAHNISSCIFHVLSVVRGICNSRNVHYEQLFNLRKKRKVSDSTLKPEAIADCYSPKAVLRRISKVIRQIEKSAG